MPKISSIQDPFLNNIRKAHISVNVFLINGRKLQGEIDAFDSFVVFLKNDENGLQMIYKHAISTIFPVSPDDTKKLADLLRDA